MTSLACSEPSPLDLAAWAGLPVACAPLGSTFEPLVTGQRLLVASNGLYLEAASPSLYIRVRIADIVTPWGNVQESLVLKHGAIPALFAKQLAAMALAEHPNEMAALIVADPNSEGSYRLHVPEGTGSASAIRYDDTGYDEGMLVVDAHSHGHYPPVFSKLDNDSDRSRLEPHISVVFGRCASADSMKHAARLCIGHYLIPLSNEVLEGLFA